ncbi:MAG: hypothetical protein OEL57_02190 [Trichlorobacter sp.]|uniref:hypothetical protein n=1 Tax=Trichlorobacter sp. TaxID=2911007 RepID=UPI00256CFE86|nr:hypothetical protein [Trichlorobacter sp.]MDK9716700.1 hypothetical protein [Trichlorobacter sp.]
MFTEINAAVQSAKALFEVVKANKGLAEYNEIVAAVSEVNTKLMSATGVALASQEKQVALTSRISELEKEIVKLKNWEREAERYQLTEICSGVFNLTVKPGMENGEPQHKLCTACFMKSKKGYLQRSDFNSQGTHYKCDCCGFEILDHSQKRETGSIRRTYSSAAHF